MNQHKKNSLIEQAQRQASVVLKKNFKDIESVTVIKDNYKFYPSDLGGLSVTGYVNNDKDLFFAVDYTFEGSKLGEVTSILKSGNFPEEKDACKKRICE